MTKHAAEMFIAPSFLNPASTAFEENSPLFNAAVLTEAEFKAAALWQAGFPCMGIPGISFVRNPVFRSRLVEMIERFTYQEAHHRFRQRG